MFTSLKSLIITILLVKVIIFSLDALELSVKVNIVSFMPILNPWLSDIYSFMTGWLESVLITFCSVLLGMLFLRLLRYICSVIWSKSRHHMCGFNYLNF